MWKTKQVCMLCGWQWPKHVLWALGVLGRAVLNMGRSGVGPVETLHRGHRKGSEMPSTPAHAVASYDYSG